MLDLAAVVTNAVCITSSLEFFRNSKWPFSLESLETDLDVRILALSRLAVQPNRQDRDNILRTLTSIREYRRRYPRWEHSPTENRDLQERARHALDEIG